MKNSSLTNKEKIYSLIYKQEPLSRADLSKQLNLSFPTISANVKDMIKAGLVFEDGIGNINNVGRKSTLLKIEREYAFVLCGNISLDESTLAFADLKGNVLLRKNIPTPKTSIQELINEIKYFSLEAVKKHALIDGKIKAISLGLHGLRDVARQKNFLHISDDLTDIQGELYEVFDCDIIVENDVNLAVLGEWWKNKYADDSNIVFINIDDGIGAGIMIDGKLFKGHRGFSGEIGNSVLDFAQMFQKFEEDGAFENLIIGEDSKSELADLIHLLHDNAKADKLLLLKIIYSNKIFIYLCMMLINLSCVLDPHTIILGGKYGLEIAKMADLLRMVIEEYIPSSSPDIVGSALGINAVLDGAIYSGINKIKSQIYSTFGDG